MRKSAFTHEYKRLCQLLIQARKDAGLTQVELAKALRRPQSFVSKYETSERRVDVVELLEICQVLRADAVAMIQTIRRR